MANRPCLLTLLALLLGLESPARSQDLRLLLPAECVVTVDIAAPSPALAALTQAVGGLPEDLPPEVQALAGAGLVAARVHLGGSIEDFVQRMAGGGAAFGLLREGPRWRPLLVLRPGDMSAAEQYLDRFGARLHRETAGDLLLVSRTAAGCERLRAGIAEPSTAVRSPDLTHAALLCANVDLEALWRAIPGPDAEALDGGGRFFLATLATALAGGTRLDLRVFAADTVRVDLRVDAAAHGTRWAGLLAAGGQARAVAPMPEGCISQIAIDRSFGALLRQPKQYLTEDDQIGVAGFLSIADLIDGATTSFVDDLIGGLVEPFVFTVLEAEPAVDEHCPLRIPGLALTAAIADPEVTRMLRRAAGVLLTIINGERAKNGKKPFILRSAASEHGVGLAAEPPLWRGPGLPPIEDALSPTVLWGHGHVVLASTHAAADRMLAALAERGPESVKGDRLAIRGATLARAIAENRAPLELGRMLDEGESPDSVARFFDIVGAVAGAIERVELTADYGPDATTLTLELERHR